MRRIVMMAMALGLAAPVVVEAQAARGGAGGEVRQAGANPAARVLALRTQLGLTAAQVSQLEQLSARLEEQHRTLREQLQAVRPEGMPRRGPAARPALTEEQRAQMRARMEARRGERPALTEEQRAQMRARMEEQRARQQELRPLMEQLRQSQQSARAQVESVLTSEQLAKLRELQQAGVRQRPIGPRGAGPRR